MTQANIHHDRRCLKKGLFIVLEGIDGAGKTTQAFLLKERIEKEGFEAVYVKEPTSGPWGQKIKDIALHGRQGISPEEELNYFILDRREDVQRNINPALKRKAVVVADRYYYSNIAYQSALGLDPERIRSLNSGFPVPDLVIILDVSPEVGRLRINMNRKEEANKGYEQADYLAAVRKRYEELSDPNIVRLDGTLDISSLARQVWEKVVPFLDTPPK